MVMLLAKDYGSQLQCTGPFLTRLDHIGWEQEVLAQEKQERRQKREAEAQRREEEAAMVAATAAAQLAAERGEQPPDNGSAATSASAPLQPAKRCVAPISRLQGVIRRACSQAKPSCFFGSTRHASLLIHSAPRLLCS